MTNETKTRELLGILEQEVKPALGCTGPIAVSFAVAVAKDAIGGTPESVRIFVDRGNCVKNDDVGIPGTSQTGTAVAAALGAICGDSKAGLNVLHKVTPDDEIEACKLAEQNVTIDIDWDFKGIGLYIDATVKTNKGVGRAVVAKTHTNVILIEVNGEVKYQKEDEDRDTVIDETKAPIRQFTTRDFYYFVRSVPYKDIAFLKDAIVLNKKLAEVGLNRKVGAGFGAAFGQLKGNSTYVKAKSLTAAASDARMAGSDYPAMSCATSGNVGITASLPLMVVAQEKGKTEEDMVRALALSFLLTIYIKNHIGRLSAMCSCVIAASVGVAAGTALLINESYDTIQAAISNTVASLCGIVCDGARLACAFKLANAVGIAFESAHLAAAGVHVPSNQGVICASADDTLALLGRIAHEGMVDTDKVLCKAMYQRNQEVRAV